jgi:hypothetical protein
LASRNQLAPADPIVASPGFLVVAYAPDWPDKITPIAEGIARRRGVGLPTFDDGTPQPD